MIVQPSLPGGYAIFCDDIRYEQNGKVSFVGCYTGEMTVYAELPATLVQLAVMIVFRLDPKTVPCSVTLRIMRDGADEEILFSADVGVPQEAAQLSLEPSDADSPDSFRFVEMRVMAQFPALIIKEPCKIKVRGFIGDDEIRLGSLAVKVATPDQAPKPDQL